VIIPPIGEAAGSDDDSSSSSSSSSSGNSKEKGNELVSIQTALQVALQHQVNGTIVSLYDHNIILYYDIINIINIDINIKSQSGERHARRGRGHLPAHPEGEPFQCRRAQLPRSQLLPARW
jgi:hypothetical protein